MKAIETDYDASTLHEISIDTLISHTIEEEANEFLDAVLQKYGHFKIINNIDFVESMIHEAIDGKWESTVILQKHFDFDDGNIAALGKKKVKGYTEIVDRNRIKDRYNKWVEVSNNIKKWQKKHGFCPVGLEFGYDDYRTPVLEIEKLSPFLEEEGYGKKDSNIYSYNAVTLFGSALRTLDFLERWGRKVKQPLHGVIQNIQFPQENRKEINFKAWGDAVMRHGPKMAKLVKFADKCVEPLVDKKGGWSYSETRNDVAKHAYKKSSDNPELALICMEYLMTEPEFNMALNVVQDWKKTKLQSDIPDIQIEGSRFDMEGYKFRKLDDGDLRGLFLGEIVDCCQSIGGHGMECAVHGFTSEHSGFYVLEDKEGQIIAETWAWRGKDDELVFDSLESLNGRVSKKQWTKLLEEVANDIEDNKKSNISSFHVGTGGDTPKLKFNKQAAKPKDYDGYRDSKKQYQVWKRLVA